MICPNLSNREDSEKKGREEDSCQEDGEGKGKGKPSLELSSLGFGEGGEPQDRRPTYLLPGVGCAALVCRLATVLYLGKVCPGDTLWKELRVASVGQSSPCADWPPARRQCSDATHCSILTHSSRMRPLPPFPHCPKFTNHLLVDF